MDTAAESIPGYTSVVHQGPLKPVLIWYAPHEYVIYNILIAMSMCLLLTGRWIVFTLLVHVILALFWFYDPHLLPALWQSRRYRTYFGTE